MSKSHKSDYEPHTTYWLDSSNDCGLLQNRLFTVTVFTWVYMFIIVTKKIEHMFSFHETIYKKERT